MHGLTVHPGVPSTLDNTSTDRCRHFPPGFIIIIIIVTIIIIIIIIITTTTIVRKIATIRAYI